MRLPSRAFGADEARVTITAHRDEIQRLVEATPAPGQHAARSALHHLDMALAIKSIDKEMAAFRALTGEEESVRAIFLALQRRRYDDADRLNWKRHDHKAAVYPFFEAVSAFLHSWSELAGLDPRIELRGSKFLVSVKVLRAGGKELRARPSPPLEFGVQLDDSPPDFKEELDRVVAARNLRSFKKHNKDRANLRNRILYASQEGIPHVDELRRFIERRQEIVLINLIVYLMIDPYPEKQQFVQQALTAFLKLLGLLREQDAEARPATVRPAQWTPETD